MKYFWYFLTLAIVIAGFIGLFFVLSLNVDNDIEFTNDDLLTAPTVTIADPSLGPTTAAITLVNFGDYACRGCAELETSLVALRTEYPDDLRIVWKDMPNTSSHPEALNAAVAAHCAGEQKQFWDYHSLLMANQTLLGQELYTELAAELELKDRQFANCLENQATLPLVQRGFEEGLALGITATPTIYINGERYTGAMTQSEIRRIIERLTASL